VENPTENYTTPMVSEIYTTQSTNKENLSLFMNSILHKDKKKAETSSLRNLNIIPRNLNEILLS
jgi:hypothetical protein